MILGQPTKLSSQFRLTYTMILNLLRVEALRVEEMIKRSFSENASQRVLPEHQKRILEVSYIMCKVISATYDSLPVSGRERTGCASQTRRERTVGTTTKVLRPHIALDANKRSFPVEPGKFVDLK